LISNGFFTATLVAPHQAPLTVQKMAGPHAPVRMAPFERIPLWENDPKGDSVRATGGELLHRSQNFSGIFYAPISQTFTTVLVPKSMTASKSEASTVNVLLRVPTCPTW
jgi:hypothetical protein